MKKIFSFIALAFLSVAAFAQTCVETDVNLTGTASITFTRYEHKNLTGLFSVAAGKQVLFSQGNLQYQASTNTWRFAEHQWDALQRGGGNETSSNRETQSKWIDMFGWGTSGWNSGATEYQPWARSLTNTDYAPGGSFTSDLTDAYAQADWAWYNPVINGGIDMNGPSANLWRVLTQSEWEYLLNRKDAGENLLYCFGSLMGTNGVYFLPDEWDWSSIDGGDFEDNWVGGSKDFTTVTIPAATGAELWETLENAGVIFLPLTGIRNNSTYAIRYSDSNGYYWSSTHYGAVGASSYTLNFNSGSIGVPNTSRSSGCAVRAVRDL